MKNILFLGLLMAFSELTFAELDYGFQFQYMETDTSENIEQYSFDNEFSFHRDQWFKQRLEDLAKDQDFFGSLEAAFETYIIQAATAEEFASVIPNFSNLNEFENEVRYRLSFSHFLSSSDPDQMYKLLNYSKENFSNHQKLRFLKELGDVFLNDYNEIEPNVAHLSLYELKDRLNAGEEDGGRCRQIAVSLAQVAEELGLGDSYVVAFKTARGGHATMITKHPELENSYVQFNYGQVTASNSSSSAILRQDTNLPDVGIQFRVFNSDGVPVARIPTEFGKLVYELAGMEVEKYNPGYKSGVYRSAKGSFNYKGFGMSVFVAKNTRGEDVVGAQVLLPPTYFNQKSFEAFIRSGFGVYKSTREATFYDTETLNALYFTEVELNTKFTDLIYDIRMRAEMGIQVALNMAETRQWENTTGEAEKGGAILETYNAFRAGLRFEKDFSDSLLLGFSYEAFGAVLKDDVQDESSKGFHVLSEKAKLYVDKQLSEHMNLKFEQMLILRDVGDSAQTVVVLASNKEGKSYLVQVGLTRALDDDIPFFIDSGQDDVFAGVEFAASKRLRLNLRYLDLKETDEGRFSLSVSGKFN